jgi:cytochrome P450
VTALVGTNRGPRVFDHPGRFDVARENAREHVSFSGARHHCLGASPAALH